MYVAGLVFLLLGIVSAGPPVQETAPPAESESLRMDRIPARDFDVIPDTGRDIAPAFRRMLATVMAMRAPAEILLEKGRYLLGTGPTHQSSITIEKARHLVVRGVGPETELILTNPKQGGFFIAESHNVWICDVAFDHDPLPYTQGHILLKSEKQGWFDLAIQPGFPLLDEEWFSSAPKPYGQWGMIFDPKKPLLKAGAADFIFMEHWRRLGSRVWRMRPRDDQRERLRDMRMGDRFVHLARHGAGGCVFFWRSSDSGADNVMVYASQSLAFGAVACDRITLKNVTVTRRPNTDRLLSANSDGFHCQQNLRGPLVIGSVFENMADDGINIYYPPNAITRVISPTVLLATVAGIIETGDSLQFFLPETGKTAGEALVAESRLSPDGQYRITLAEPVSEIRAGSNGHMIYNLSRCGADFHIKDNTFRHHRRHAMMLKAPRGVIEGNWIEAVAGLGIVAGNDPEWPEGVIPFDLQFRNNHVQDVGYARWYGADPRGAAIQVFSRRRDSGPAEGRDLRSVLLENNRIVNPPGAALYIGAAKNVHIRGLQVMYGAESPPPRETAAIIVENAAGIRVEGLRIESQRPEIFAGILVEPSVEPGSIGLVVEDMHLTAPSGMQPLVDRR